MINDLKVYERMKRKEERKKKRKKRFKLFIVTSVITITMLSSCHVINNLKADDVPNNQTYYTETVEATKSDVEAAVDNLMDSYASKTIDEYNMAVINSSVTLSESDAAYISNKIKNTSVNYAYSDLYDVESAYQEYLKLPSFSGEIYPILKNGTVDANELYELVIKNNVTYKEQNPYSIYTKLDDSYIREYCKMVAESVNNILAKGWDYNLEDLSYNLQHLCMFKSATGSNAFISNDGCLIVQPANLETMKAIYNNDDADKITIAHETTHLFQRIATNNKDSFGIDMGYGFNYSFNNLKVNSLFNKWYEEATAETLASSLYNSDPMTYATKISYLNSLRYVHGLKANFDVDSLEKLSMQNSLETVFEEFGCQTEEEKMELLKVLFSINIIQEQPDDFINLYEEQVLGHEMSEDELIQLQIELKSSICQYLTNQFYANLSNRIVNQNVKLEEIFKLVSTLESTLNVHLKYTLEERFETYESFFNEYLNTQNTFFQIIADKLNLNLDDIVSAYNEYNGQMEIKTESMLRETVYEQMDISWMNSKQQAVVQSKHEETSGNKTVSINEYSNIMQNVKKY